MVSWMPIVALGDGEGAMAQQGVGADQACNQKLNTGRAKFFRLLPKLFQGFSSVSCSLG